MGELIITSPAFESDGWIPNRNSAYGEDVSPELHIEGLSESSVSLMITLDDMGHPIQPGYNHWVAWNLPPINVIPEHLPKDAVCEQPIHIEQGLAYGKHCYRGPKRRSTGIMTTNLQSMRWIQSYQSARIRTSKLS